ncbi:AbrB family transcriptional regulator [Halobacillus mangrovi]|uniref:AbrB family transcriptional regulator n=1 Tax=Halobacillus mangrovi TaxID=402384 RepID=UPI003D9910D4
MVRKETFVTYGIALCSGIGFKSLHLPLPWILGPVTGLLLLKLLLSYETSTVRSARDIGFTILGVQIGLTFTAQTFTLVFPYLLPYTVLSLLLISTSLFLAYLIAKKTAIDMKTSMIGSAPGGLSAMLAVSESLKGNTVLVTIFHTIRLLSVLFIIPFIATHFLSGSEAQKAVISSESSQGPLWTTLIYLAAFGLGYRFKDRIPASCVILPMLLIGLLQAFGFPLYQLPQVFYIGAQVIIGVHLGNSIRIRDLVIAGKYCSLYFGLSIIIITLGIFLGWLLTSWTGMDFATAVLSLAPGGLVEMSITATEAGAQPALVSSLQMIRLLFIVMVLPLLFQKILPRVHEL